MKVIDSITELEQLEKGWALTIGNFDGVHQGHQAIIDAACESAERAGACGVAVMTFDPHPVAILHPEKAPGVLAPLEMKKCLLEKAGVDCMIVIRDSRHLLNLSPEVFVDEFLMRMVKPLVVIEGPNFNFGYGRSGDIETLKSLGSDRGFEVVVVPPMNIEVPDEYLAGRKLVSMCSSSLVRNMLERGHVRQASAALGRYYRLVGKTVPGRGVGTQIGFPTANIDPVKQIVPDEGVYAGFVGAADDCHGICVSADRRLAVFSIGRAKTFLSDHPLLIEAHILEEDVEPLAGKWLAMDFVQHIRHQQRFSDKDALVAQIKKDCMTARGILAAE